MAYDDYVKANKKGKKQYKSSIVKGEFPYLPVLDDMISLSDVECEINMGVQSIPLSRVVGTASFGRTTAFSNQFMPLLNPQSEFGRKWATLYDSQLEEGIRDPIKVYEYMNLYYVIEGNKRVSVMKYLNAVSIAAEVLRKIPKRTDDPENRIYYEYMAFHRLSNINNIWFSKEGNFSKLQECIKGSLDEPWNDDDQKNFSSLLINFEKYYQAAGGKKLPITTGDALLSFILTYGYEECLEMSTIEMKESIEKYWQEFTLLSKPETKELLLDPDGKSTAAPNVTKNLLNFILPAKKLKVAFFYDKEPDDSGWVYAHELGRQYLEENLKKEIQTTYVVCTPKSEDLDIQLEQIIEEGYQVIFTTSPNLSKTSLKIAVDHPEVKILNCSLNIPTSHVRSYYARMYEIKFLTGLIAGAMTENDKIGYVADYPIYGAIANINSFALGAKMVNPRAKIYLTWDTIKDHNVETFFNYHNIKYISDKDMADLREDNRQFGLCQLKDGIRTNIAMTICNWGIFYKKLLQSIVSGTWKNLESGENPKALNYWWGLSAEVIEVICSKYVPESTVKLVNLFHEMIKSGYFRPFSGKLVAQGGKIIQKDDNASLNPIQIINMDWLCDNVIGYIPTMEQLTSNAKSTVKVQGIAGDKANCKLIS